MERDDERDSRVDKVFFDSRFVLVACGRAPRSCIAFRTLSLREGIRERRGSVREFFTNALAVSTLAFTYGFATKTKALARQIPPAVHAVHSLKRHGLCESECDLPVDATLGNTRQT